MNTTSPTPDDRSPFTAMRRQIESTPLPDAAGASPAARLASRLAERPRLAAGGVAATAGTAAAGTAAALAIGLGAFTGATPAFAVTTNPDGSVTMTLDELSATGALNARLASDGIAVRAVPVQTGCSATADVVEGGTAGVPAAAFAQPLLRAVEDPDTGKVISVTVSPPTEPARTLIVAVGTDGSLLAGEIVQGAVPACVAPQDV